MDRNLWWGVRKAVGSLVALRKESVDRNILPTPTSQTSSRSLSARRAWIEIYNYIIRLYRRIVALRKESVDRNEGGSASGIRSRTSLSARRAWIEILRQLQSALCRRRSLSARRAWIEMQISVSTVVGVLAVALRKESVDRNSFGLSRVDTVSVALRKESVDRN